MQLTKPSPTVILLFVILFYMFIFDNYNYSNTSQLFYIVGKTEIS